MSGAKTPVFLLTGFLGSGKTTLLNKALKDPALANTAVVVNELGEIGLDNLVIAQATDNVVLLDAGCLCCANTGALHETLADLNGRRARGEIPPFERVIIETSGAADPAPLINVLLGHPLVTGAYAFEATVCAVDAQHFLASRAEYPEPDKQAALADRIVATKTDLADPAPALDFVRELNPGAEVCDSVASLFSALPVARRHRTPISSLGPIRGRDHFSGIRAHAFRPAPPVTWAGWSAWCRLAAAEFGARLHPRQGAAAHGRRRRDRARAGRAGRVPSAAAPARVARCRSRQPPGVHRARSERAGPRGDAARAQHPGRNAGRLFDEGPTREAGER